MIPTLDQEHNMALARSWLLPGLVGTVQDKVILNCRRTGKESSEIGINSGRNTQRNERMNEQQGGRKNRKEWKIKKEEKLGGGVQRFRKSSYIRRIKEKPSCQLAQRKSCNLSWMVFQLKPSQVVHFFGLFSWKVYTLVQDLWRVVKATESPAITKHHLFLKILF